MAYDFVKGITPSKAKYVWNKIVDVLTKLGYEIEQVGNTQLITGKNTITQFQQDFKISYVWNDAWTKKYIMSDNAPVMTVSLLGYSQQDFPNTIIYNLSAKIPGTRFDWEGEDTDLMSLVDIFLDDAKNDILNDMSEFIEKVEEKDLSVAMYDSINKKLEDSVLRIYEGLYKQVKENAEDKTEDASLEDLEQKIDIIMDALGLKEEEKEEKTEVEVETEDTEQVQPEEVEDEQKTEFNFVDEEPSSEE